MADTKYPTKPLENAEKFKPKDVQHETGNEDAASNGKAPDTPRGSDIISSAKACTGSDSCASVRPECG